MFFFPWLLVMTSSQLGARFEMACLFEYAILPITAENLVDLSGPDEAAKTGVKNVGFPFLSFLKNETWTNSIANYEFSNFILSKKHQYIFQFFI